MKKTKDGKVIASLTEVKNKTGDIFALADEYGEVFLTSYNKPRYKIVKLNVSSLLEEEDSKPARKSDPKPVFEKKIEDELHTENPAEAEKKLIDKVFAVNPWNRESEVEKQFITKATKPLI